MPIFKKLSATILIASFFISINAPVAQADWFDIGNPASASLDAMDALMGSMGVDPQAAKNMVQEMNVAGQKKTPPTVTLTFTPTNPTPGENITATASPTYFFNDANILYYTWIFKRGYCNDGVITENSSIKERSCDLDGNGRVNIEDYKIEAARIIANGNFDWQSALGRDSSNCTGSDQPEYCNSDDQYNNAIDDNDGYDASYGGDDQKGKTPYCYLHDTASGNDYPLTECKHLFPHAPSEVTGDGAFNLSEEKFWHTNPNSKDTANRGTADEAAVSGLGKIAFTWNYTPGDKISVAVEGVAVDPNVSKDSSYKTMWAIPNSALETDLDEDIPTSNFTETASPTTASITTPIIVPMGDYNPSDYDPIIQTVTRIDNSYEQGDYVVNETGAGSSIMERQTTTITEKTYTATATDDGINYTVLYTLSSTADSEVIPTDPELIFYSFLDLKTDIGDLNSQLKKSMVEPSEKADNKNLDITLSPSIEQPVNDFSSTGEHADTLEIQSLVLNATDKAFLKYSWQFFLGADLAGADSWPVLTKSSLADQAELMQTTGLGLQSVKLKLNFKEDFLRGKSISTANTPFYLKALLRATESAEKNGHSETAKEGVGTIIIPIHFSDDAKIRVFYTAVDNSNISLDTTERCNTDLESVICPVLKNEIVGVKFEPADSTDIANYDFLWKLDGKSLTVDETYPNIASFPVLDEKGTSYALSLSVSNKITGEKNNLLRTFKISDPEINILTNDQATCAPILLGNYIDLDNKQWPDYSADSFEAIPGTTVKLKATANPAALINKATWFVNGIAVTANADGTLDVPIPMDMPLGEAYTVGIGALYTQPASVKKILNTKWNVPLTAFYEKQVGSSITIKMVDHLSSAPAGTAKINKQKVLASLFSELPAYVNFLFRIILTILLILFSTGMLFSIFPKQNQL